MSVYEDEHPSEDLQYVEVRMASGRGRSKDSERSCETYRKNAGVELNTPAFLFYFFLKAKKRCPK
jgi:hypothetical protein